MDVVLKAYKGFYYKHACGVKTGFTDEAGRCLVAAARQNGTDLIAVVLNDKQDWLDCKRLLDVGFSKYKTISLPKDLPNDDVSSLKLKWSGEQDREIPVDVGEPLKVGVLDSMYSDKRLTKRIVADPIYLCKIKKGDKVGEVEYFLDGYFLGKTDLLAGEDFG